MSTQYITDDNGKKLAVILPIKDYNEMMDKLNDKDTEENNIQSWQKEEVRKRLDDYKNNPELALDFDIAMDDIEKDL